LFKKIISFVILWCVGSAFAIADNTIQVKNVELRREVMSLLKEYSIPGAVVTYGFENQPLQTVSVGYGDIQNKSVMNPKTVFIIGSITKSFVAAAILELVEAHKIQVDETLGEIAKQYRGALFQDVSQYPNLNNVTVKELLNHTSGVPEDVNTLEFITAFINNPQKIWSDQDLLAVAMKQPFYFPPGEPGAWSYTNTDYLLLSIVLKSVTHETMPEIFNQLWQRAGLENIYYADNGIIPESALQYLTTGYIDIHGDDNLVRAFKNFPTAVVPGSKSYTAYALKTGYNVFDPTSSAIITNTQTIAKWYRVLFEGGLLKPATVRMMLDGVSVAKENNLKYGFGVATAVMPKYGYLVTHNGLGPGYSIEVLYSFKYHLVLAIATNSSNLTVNTFDIFSGKLLPGFVTEIMPILVGNKND
jgi:D-alanyl-D-alanine carboxypeptidase